MKLHANPNRLKVVRLAALSGESRISQTSRRGFWLIIYHNLWKNCTKMKEFGLRDGRVASLAPSPWNGKSWVCTGRYLCCLVLRREWQNDTSECMHPVMHIMRQYYGGKWKRISTHPMIHTVYLTMPLLGSGKEGMATCQQYTCLQMIAHWRHYWRALPSLGPILFKFYEIFSKNCQNNTLTPLWPPSILEILDLPLLISIKRSLQI